MNRGLFGNFIAPDPGILIPHVMIGLHAVQSIPNTTGTDIIWTKVIDDELGLADLQTGRIVIPSGVKFVRFWSLIEWASNTTGSREGHIDLLPFDGGFPSRVAKAEMGGETESAQTLNSGPILVRAGDKYVANVYQASGGALNLSENSLFGMEILGMTVTENDPSVAIGTEKDLRAVAIAAGQPDRHMRLYSRGRLHVAGVTQAALDAAAAAAVAQVQPDIEERFDIAATAIGRLLIAKGVCTRQELRQAIAAVIQDRRD